ncbi:MAG: hypothetical protein RI894_948, partial [Bacteroidota bacterium]
RIGISSIPTNNSSCNPQIDTSYLANNTFGAIFSEGATGTDNAVFTKKTVYSNNNSATSGGAIQQLVGGSGNVSITDCVFVGNSAATGSGGAVYIFRKSASATSGLTLQNSSLSQNTASLYGGAIATNSAGTQVWLRNKLLGNSARDGGAIAILNTNASATQIFSNNNALRGNSATRDGGAFIVQATNLVALTCQNNLFTGNNAAGAGGVFTANLANTVFKNCVFSGNKAATEGVMKGVSAQTAQLYNCIIWSNSSITTTDALLANCVVEGGWNGTGSLNLSDNPLFLNPVNYALAPTTSGDFHTKICSPATNSGNNAYAPAQTDLDDKTRILANIVDIGVYEQNANYHFSTPSSAGINLVANTECDTPDGWTHFYDSNTNTILFSINRNGNDASSAGHDIGSYNNPATPILAELHTTAAFGSNIATNRSSAPYVTSPDGWFTGNMYWKLTPFNEPNLANPVSVRVYYNSNLLSDLTGSVSSVQQDITKCAVFKVDNPYNPLDNTVTSSAFHQYLYSETESNTAQFTKGVFQNMAFVEFKTTSFSGGGIGASGGNNGALPVEILGFDAKRAENNAVLLAWETASEHNSDYFAIERSADGRNFETITTVKGANLPQGSRYNYTDTPLTGAKSGKMPIFYYRLRPTDFDGTFTYSPIRSVILEVKETNEVQVFPNPAVSFLNIRTNNTERTMQLIDETGRVRIDLPIVTETLDVSNLENGVFFLQIAGEASVKIVKN